MALRIFDVAIVPAAPVLALRGVSVHVTRMGAETESVKIARLLEPASLAIKHTFAIDGSSAIERFLASAIDGTYLLLVTDATPPAFAAARYPTISEDITFTLDLNDGSGGGGGTPAELAAIVRLERLPAQREVIAIERKTDATWAVAGFDRAGEDGRSRLDLRVTSGSVYALCVDDFGVAYQPLLEVEVGQRIRPTQYAGWLYEITEAGLLPSAEPEWWAAVGENPSRPLGTARAVARRYFQPIAHGPVPVEVI